MDFIISERGIDFEAYAAYLATVRNRLPMHVAAFAADERHFALDAPETFTIRAIVEQLCRAPKSAKDLAEPLHITLAAVVQHPQRLEESGLIRTTKIGRVRTCHIEPSGLQVAQQWIAKRRSLWERRLDRLGAGLMAERK